MKRYIRSTFDSDSVDNQIWELQKATNHYKNTDPLADWVLFSIHRYIYSGRATPAFIHSFLDYDASKFPELIKKCLNGDRSDDGIIKTCKRIFGIKI